MSFPAGEEEDDEDDEKAEYRKMVQEGIEGKRDFPRVNLHKEGEEPAAQVGAGHTQDSSPGRPAVHACCRLAPHSMPVATGCRQCSRASRPRAQVCNSPRPPELLTVHTCSAQLSPA